MTLPELREARDNARDSVRDLEDRIASIKTQIQSARFEKDAGLRRSEVWFRKAAYKKRKLGQQLKEEMAKVTALNHAIKEANMETAKVAALEDSVLFVEHAKRILQHEIYLSIWISVNNERSVASERT